ncbi:PH domain-containing protein [uncultured Flavobacterium sp.]|uniref:PH domain-containing protein n=1 Tax=uncultured Flavobacterium sp. TaxID=165435 RepID=UPI0025F4A3CA|nr:PH domain-containing protein [uncultured Flavobacterium sp.]
MKTYRSKIDIWLLLLIFVPLCFSLLETIVEGEWMVAGILILTIAFVIYLIFCIRYVINGETLEVKMGFMGTKRIEISDISSVEKNNNAISSPAMSLKRLEIWYGGKYDSIVISPPDREAFVKELLRVNPNITLKNIIIPQ